MKTKVGNLWMTEAQTITNQSDVSGQFTRCGRKVTQYYCPFGAAPILCALVHTADCHHRLTDCTSQLSEN
eukprot:m.26568 g.26568  ORF g.26568 m.26568 type:complete len:70 (-) comp6328_c0_seq2:64-273(-)